MTVELIPAPPKSVLGLPSPMKNPPLFIPHAQIVLQTPTSKLVSITRNQDPTMIPPTMTAGLSECDSRTVFQTVNGSYTFVITNFSEAQSRGVGQFVSSDAFAVGGYDWTIYFYPGGMSPEDSEYSSAFIALMTDDSDVRALYELRVEDQSGNGNHQVFTLFHHPLVKGPHTLMYRENMWGYPRFLKRDDPETLRFIKDDRLILQCTIGVVKTQVQGQRHYRIAIPPNDMGQGLKALLDSGLGTDINIIVGDKTFKAHKLILAARSPVFRARFFGPMGDSNIEKLVVEDVDPSIFQAMLEFIYTDEFPDISQIAGSISPSTYTDAVLHLVAAADRYSLNRLILLCESKLSERITVDTVASIVALADQHQFHKLKAICLNFAANPANLGAVLKSEGFRHLESNFPSLLSELLSTVPWVGTTAAWSSKGHGRGNHR
ncbi:BTB/POZ and MATH domain-containing protein 3-like [Rhodamnia argentea]|uniref:BTB/POZ and MATH domain-containing protein 3-like n=1 Tax=Rhodamnia argentea TaxID=178133 RepID=A0A8B8PKE4_9MYRT|nr:BTB/POZ and MATH domain-containing protein 3-like [Rhodamnia argentea]